MFFLHTIQDAVRIHPQDLGKPTLVAISQALEQVYIDKVIHDLGLVVTLYDVVHIGEGSIFHSEGGVHYKVEFRLVVFRPFQDELLVGRIKQMNENGLQVSLGFFHDVHIPAELLQQPAHWNEATSEWSWRMSDEDTPPLFYTRGQEVRFKVHAVRFHQLPSLAVQAEQRRTGMLVEGSSMKPHVPMEVLGRVDSTGLGMIAWAWG